MLQFVALVDFHSEETRSQYVKGLSYKVRPGNEKLRALAEQWQRDGKVVFNAILAQSGALGGTGEVR